MNAITLPCGTMYIRYSIAAHLLTTAMCPQPKTAGAVAGYRDVYAAIDNRLSRAVELGDLVVRDPLTHARHLYPVGNALREADILVEDLRHYAKEHDWPAIEFSSRALDAA
ncbi:MAG: hypothetical protein QM739_13840 [Propionivibrio sp.]